MGAIMKKFDCNIGTFLDMFNLRFCPCEGTGDVDYGGIAEMAALQKEFEIFRTGRPFAQSCAVLGLCGLTNNQAKNLWLTLLGDLNSYESDKPGENGDQRIVNAMIANLAAQQPLPCYMRAHDSRAADARKVIVLENDKPLFYVEQSYVTISLPMRPRRKTAKK